MGAWIEIFLILNMAPVDMSLPSWERGLKYKSYKAILNAELSLPSWERGLKSIFRSGLRSRRLVAPLVGAWIEINGLCDGFYAVKSLPSWERGLK